MKKVFDQITIEALTIKPDEWYLYEGCVKTAEAFAKTLLVKPYADVVDFINKICRNNYKPGDFTGNVKVKYHGQETYGLKYKICFELRPKAKKRQELRGSVELSILAIKQKTRADIFKGERIDVKGSSTREYPCSKGTPFEYKGNRYLIEIPGKP